MRKVLGIIIFFSLIVLSVYLASINSQNKHQSYEEKISFTIEELSKFDGKDGRPAYVAVSGIVYDFTKCRYWKKGGHTPSRGKIWAGQDLTDDLKNSPHKESYLKRYPMVGWLVESKKVNK